MIVNPNLISWLNTVHKKGKWAPAECLDIVTSHMILAASWEFWPNVSIHLALDVFLKIKGLFPLNLISSFLITMKAKHVFIFFANEDKTSVFPRKSLNSSSADFVSWHSMNTMDSFTKRIKVNAADLYVSLFLCHPLFIVKTWPLYNPQCNCLSDITSMVLLVLYWYVGQDTV